MTEFRRAEKSDEQQCKELLRFAVGNPTSNRLRSILDSYWHSDERFLFVWEEAGGEIVGVLGIESQENQTVISQIAVAPAQRLHGIARKMIEAVARIRPALLLVAETDDEGRGFYQKLGFSSSDLGEMYPGVHRYRCTR